MSNAPKPRSRSEENNYVPTSYEDLHRHYVIGRGQGNSLVHQLIRTMMPYATDEEKEILPQEIMAKCLQFDVLKLFDTTKANFGGVIFFVTRSVVGNYLGRKSRNPLTGLNGGSLVEKDAEEIFEPGIYSLDRLFGAEESDPVERIEARRLVAALVSWAKGLADAPRHKRDQSLLPLLQRLSLGEETKDIATCLDVSPSTVSNWLLVLRQKVTEMRAAAATGLRIY